MSNTDDLKRELDEEETVYISPEGEIIEAETTKRNDKNKDPTKLKPTRWYAGRDVLYGGLILIPLAVILTSLLFLFFRGEINLPNVITVFAGIFGILSIFYFLWKIKG